MANKEFVQGLVVWFTGLSGAGKSTVAAAVKQRIFEQCSQTVFSLDGDALRSGLCSDLGFSDKDRIENMRRAAELSRLMADEGFITLSAFISPFREQRAQIKNTIGSERFVEVFIDTPLSECERRDPKGLYASVRRGQIKNFSGVDSAFEQPLQPDIHVPTLELNPAQAAYKIVDFLVKNKLIVLSAALPTPPELRQLS